MGLNLGRGSVLLALAYTFHFGRPGEGLRHGQSMFHADMSQIEEERRLFVFADEPHAPSALLVNEWRDRRNGWLCLLGQDWQRGRCSAEFSAFEAFTATAAMSFHSSL